MDIDQRLERAGWLDDDWRLAGGWGEWAGWMMTGGWGERAGWMMTGGWAWLAGG